MDDDEIREAWDRYLIDGDLEARDDLFRHYLHLPRILARKALAKAPAWQDPDDIMSYAQEGLRDALSKFKPSVGVKFETYATRRISGAIKDGQRRDDPLVRGERKRVKDLERATEELWDELQREPTVEELAERLDDTVEAVKSTLLSRKSLAVPLEVAQGPLETMGVADDSEVAAQLRDAREHLADKMSTLPEHLQALLLAIYARQMPLHAIDKLGLSPSSALKTELLHSLRR